MNIAPGLERNRYPIPSLDARGAGASFATRASFDGCVVCASAPRARVQTLLPPELRLAGDDADRHPILVVFGEQSCCAMRVGGVEVEREIAYGELALLVPFVTHRRVRQLCVYVPGMLSSYYLSNWTGKVHYGYAKRLARIDRRPPIFAASTPEQGLVFEALVEPDGPWLDPADAESATPLRALRAIASLPWVGRKPNGPFVRSWSDWGFDGARLRGIRARCTVHAPFVDRLSSGEIPVDSEGSLEVRGMTWWLSWPQACPF